MREPTNSGYRNKYYDVEVCGGDTEACYESSSDSSESSDENDGYTETQTFQFDARMGDNIHDIMMNVQSQVGNILHGINLGGNFQTNFEFNHEEVDSEDEEEEEEKYGDYNDGQEEDPEADISPEQRVEIINSINSFSYKGGSEDQNCAVCLSKLEEGQQVKKLLCSHTFHPK